MWIWKCITWLSQPAAQEQEGEPGCTAMQPFSKAAHLAVAAILLRSKCIIGCSRSCCRRCRPEAAAAAACTSPPPLPLASPPPAAADPLGLGVDSDRLKWYAEAEKTNGRWAMAAVAGILFTDILGKPAWFEAGAEVRVL